MQVLPGACKFYVMKEKQQEKIHGFSLTCELKENKINITEEEKAKIPFDPERTIIEICKKFKGCNVFWTRHSREQMKIRGIDRRWVRSQVANGHIKVVDFIWSHGFPEKLLLNIGSPPGQQAPVHVCIVNETPKAAVITVYWVDFEHFEENGLTRKRGN